MKKLSTEEEKIYEWQLNVPDFGLAGQEKLKNSTALISRTGGLGGPLAFELACAGVGKLILAHGGNLKHSDINRQILMKYDGIGKPRCQSSEETLKRFNPFIEVECVDSNINEENAEKLVSKADIVFDCAPLFEERYLLNRECVRQKKPLVDCAMYNMECQLMNYIPEEDTPCLQCIFPEKPVHWKRKFPVFGAVSAMVAAMGAIEGIKILSGIGKPLTNQLLYINTLNFSMQKVPIQKNSNCIVCNH